ncbi:hypothetical protein NL476_28020, partial [Klebsiella pneumoniae]|nr:hypothetical protein [Klebsiella pneumoniae]
ENDHPEHSSWQSLIATHSLCPLNADRAVEAWAAFPISPNDVEGMPSISLDIPDFEGSATLRLFANSSETEIGCFRAVMHNGRS